MMMPSTYLKYLMMMMKERRIWMMKMKKIAYLQIMSGNKR